MAEVSKTKISLPPRGTIEGAKTRILMAECRGPSSPKYKIDEAKQCMQLMNLVLYNRLNNTPAHFGAKNAKSILDIIKAPGQFAGFENYPNYSPGIVHNLQMMVDIANNARDHRNGVFAEFINAAMEVAKASTPVNDPSPGTGSFLAFWRTEGSSGPGGNSQFVKTVGGNDFYCSP